MTHQRFGGRRSGVTRTLGMLAMGLALLSTGQTAAADCQLEVIQIPVKLVNRRPIATVTLNGTDVQMLVDSGAFHSMLTEAAAAKLKLTQVPLRGMRIVGWAGDLDASLAKVAEVKLGGSVLPDLNFVVGLNELGSGIDGVLGRNILSLADTEFDLAHGMVRMVFPKGDCAKTNLAYWAGEAPVVVVPLEASRRDGDTTVRMTVKLNGVDVRAMADTGAPRTVVKLHAAQRAGVKDADLIEAGTAGGAGAGRVKSWTTRFRTFELGGEKIANNQFFVDDAEKGGEEMLIGLDYFLSHRIYVARTQTRVYVTWNGGPVFARELSSASSGAADAAAEIAPDDADAFARRGAAFAARGEHARALADLNRACELAPGNAGYLVARARLGARSWNDAIADLGAALKIDPSLHDARLLRASLRRRAGDRDGALADLAELDKVLPASAGMRSTMGSDYATLKQVPQALRQWELWVASHESDGSLPAVLNQRCWLRAGLGIELDKALRDCKQAVRLVKIQPEYRDSLGWTYLRLGDAQTAMNTFNEIIEQRAASPSSLYGRALAYRQRGWTDAAARDVQAARRFRPDIDDDLKEAGFITTDGLLSPLPPAGRP